MPRERKVSLDWEEMQQIPQQHLLFLVVSKICLGITTKIIEKEE